jgi:hypothetical protein
MLFNGSCPSCSARLSLQITGYKFVSTAVTALERLSVYLQRPGKSESDNTRFAGSPGASLLWVCSDLALSLENARKII